MYQLSRLIFGKARSFAPIIRGIRKFPKHRGDGGNQEEENHGHAVHREHAVVGIGGEQSSQLGVSRCRRIIMAKKPPMKKKKVTETR